MTIEERAPDKWSIPINTGTMDEGLNDGSCMSDGFGSAYS